MIRSDRIVRQTKRRRFQDQWMVGFGRG